MESPRLCRGMVTFIVVEERLTPTDCLGDHDVMARQVTPGSIQPDSSLALQTRLTDVASISEFHQGQRHRLDQSPNVWLQSLPFEPSTMECLANPQGRPCKAARPRAVTKYPDISLFSSPPAEPGDFPIFA